MLIIKAKNQPRAKKELPVRNTTLQTIFINTSIIFLSPTKVYFILIPLFHLKTCHGCPDSSTLDLDMLFEAGEEHKVLLTSVDVLSTDIDNFKG